MNRELCCNQIDLTVIKLTAYLLVKQKTVKYAFKTAQCSNCLFSLNL